MRSNGRDPIFLLVATDYKQACRPSRAACLAFACWRRLQKLIELEVLSDLVRKFAHVFSVRTQWPSAESRREFGLCADDCVSSAAVVSKSLSMYKETAGSS